jgi:hypothetical protein
MLQSAPFARSGALQVIVPKTRHTQDILLGRHRFVNL